jgi:hypothetical protein
MSEMVLDIDVLPKALFSRIKAKKVIFHEENGVFTVIPVADGQKSFDRIIGMFPDGRLSIDTYLKEKQLEKALELCNFRSSRVGCC